MVENIEINSGTCFEGSNLGEGLPHGLRLGGEGDLLGAGPFLACMKREVENGLFLMTLG